MAGLDYTPNNSVAPQGAPSNDHLNVRANSNDFGGQVGAANTGLGKTLEGVGNEAIQTGLQIQGVANEHAATAAEMQLAVQGGDVYNQYKSLTGFDAANTKDKYIADYMKVSDNIRASLPNSAAQRSYDQLATRRMSFTIQDMNSYAAEQQKKGYVTGKTASMNLSIDAASKYEVASNPAQLGFELGSVRFTASDLYTNPEYGIYRTVPATQNKDGSVSFNTDTAQGKAAQADYDNYVNLAVGKTYKNAVTTLAYDPQHGDVIKASQFLSDNQSKMPSATFAELSHGLAPAIKQEQARSGAHDYADSVLAQAGTPENTVMPDVSKFFPGATVTSTLRTPEHNAEVGGVPNSAHLTGQAVDFVPPAGLTIDQAKARMVSEGYNVTEALNEGDHFHLGWAPKVNAPGVPSNVAQGADSYRNQAVYVGTHLPELIDNARRLAEEKFPDDSPTQDAFVSHVTQRLGNVVSAQRSADLRDKQTITGYIQKQGVTSEQQIMQSNDPNVRNAWLRMNANDTYAAGGLRNYIAANAQGKHVTLGTGFYGFLVSTLSGKTQDGADLDNAIVPGNSHSPLTTMGVDYLKSRLDPSQHSSNQAELQYFQSMHKLYTGGFLAAVPDTESTPQFDHALLDIVPKIQSGRQRGLTDQQMFSPKINGKDNPDYISSSIAPPPTSDTFARVNAKTLSTITKSSTSTNDTYNTLDDIKKAKDAGKLTYQQAVDLGRKKGLLAPEAPKVPMDLN